MVKRFTEEVQLTPQPVSTGAAQGLMSLVNKLEGFKQQTEQLQVAIGERKGREEAAGVEVERDVEGRTIAPEFKKQSVTDIILTGGARTQAFNKTIRDGYLASLENDLRLDMATIEQENPDNITIANEKMEALRSGALKGVDPTSRPAVQKFLDSQITSARIRIQGKTLEKTKQEANASRRGAIKSAGNQAATMARQGDRVSSAEALQDAFANIDGMVETGDLTTDKAAEVKRGLEREATEQGFRFQLDAQAETEGTAAAFAELEKVRNEVPKGWTPDEWDTFIGSAQADLNGKAARNSRARAELDLETSREISNLKIQARTGTGEPSEIIQRTEELFNEGKINEATRTSIVTNIINTQKETVKVAESKQKVANRLSGNPEVVLTQKDVDLTWDEDIAPAVAGLPLEQKNASITEFVDSTKVIPTQVKNRITSNLNSLDPALVVESAGLMDRLDGVRGIPEDNFSSNERAFAENVVLLSQNLDPQEAFNLARKNTDPNDRARIETRTQTIKDEKFRLGYPDTVDDAFSPFFGATRLDPINEGRLTREYGVLFEQHFKAGMDESAAQAKAIQILERNWGETNITDAPRAMKYPPDDYYAVAGNVKYIGDQLLAETQAENLFGREIAPEMLRLVSDQETARTAGLGEPTYSVIVDLAEEGLVPIQGFRWKPDMTAEIERQTKAQEKRVKKLRTPEGQSLEAVGRLGLESL